MLIKEIHTENCQGITNHQNSKYMYLYYFDIIVHIFIKWIFENLLMDVRLICRSASLFYYF